MCCDIFPFYMFCVCVCVLLSGLESSTLHPMASIPTMNVDFDAVFGTKSSNSDVNPSAGKMPGKSQVWFINNRAY